MANFLEEFEQEAAGMSQGKLNLPLRREWKQSLLI